MRRPCPYYAYVILEPSSMVSCKVITHPNTTQASYYLTLEANRELVTAINARQVSTSWNIFQNKTSRGKKIRFFCRKFVKKTNKTNKIRKIFSNENPIFSFPMTQLPSRVNRCVFTFRDSDLRCCCCWCSSCLEKLQQMLISQFNCALLRISINTFLLN